MQHHVTTVTMQGADSTMEGLEKSTQGWENDNRDELAVCT